MKMAEGEEAEDMTGVEVVRPIRVMKNGVRKERGVSLLYCSKGEQFG
jgi:hypothetical protein